MDVCLMKYSSGNQKMVFVESLPLELVSSEKDERSNFPLSLSFQLKQRTCYQVNLTSNMREQYSSSVQYKWFKIDEYLWPAIFVT